jgi:hypothetical protein
MPTMFRQLFASFAVLFSAMEKYFKALDHIGTYVEESTGAFADQARIERQQKFAALSAPTAPQLPNNS